MDFLSIDLLQPESIIKYGGVVLLTIIIFVETGLFFGFFLPGDSLLFVAGILTESKFISMSVWLMMALVILAAVLGSTVGYGVGYWAKGYLEQRKENFFYRKCYFKIAERLFRKYGMSTFIVGRFLPVVRTFNPILAGMVRMDIRNFLIYNIVGAAIWVVTLVYAGYWLGNSVPSITNHLEWIILAMILLSTLPIGLTWWRNRDVVTKEMYEEND